MSVSDPQQRQQMATAFEHLLDHGQFVLGTEVDTFEENLAHYCDVKRAVGVSSGSTALFLSLKALGIGPGDEVITSSVSFVASANAIALTGATPVFADIGSDFNLCASTIEPHITARTKAIMPIHYGGLMADMRDIMELANTHGLVVIEDASQAFGATQAAQYAGTLGALGCISLNPMKILAALGEAGIVVTNNHNLADKLKALRYNGLNSQQNCEWVSSNGRLDTLQAAMLNIRLAEVNSLIARRRDIAAYYRQRIAEFVDCPNDIRDRRHVYYTFTIISEQRDTLLEHLQAQGIEVKVYHKPTPLESAYQSGCRGEWRNAARLFEKKAALPCNEKLTDEEVNYVADKVRQFFCK